MYHDSHKVCPEGVIGEFWVQSECFPNAIFENFKLNQEKLKYSPKIADDKNEKSLFIRTGVVGFLFENEIFPVGQLSDQLQFKDEQSILKYFYGNDIKNTILHYSSEVNFW